jgi:hypothetical protein
VKSHFIIAKCIFLLQLIEIRLQDLRDNPGARTTPRQVTSKHNQAGHTIGELQHASKPPLGWVWGNFYRPWQRLFPGERFFNGDINIRVLTILSNQQFYYVTLAGIRTTFALRASTVDRFGLD